MAANPLRLANNPQVLVVVSDADVREAIGRVLSELSMVACTHAASLDEALELMSESPPEAVVVDADLTTDVRPFLRAAARCGAPGVVLISTRARESVPSEGDVEFLRAPFEVDSLLEGLERARTREPASCTRARVFRR